MTVLIPSFFRALSSLALIFGLLVQVADAQVSLRTEYGSLSLVEVPSSIASKTAQEFENAAFHAVGQSVAFRDAYHLLLQFEDILSTKERRELAQQGVHVEHYVPERTYVARVERHVSVSDLLVYGLTAFGSAAEEHKMAPSFLHEIRQQRSDTYLIRVSYSPSISPAWVREALQQLPGSRHVTVYGRTFHAVAELPASEVHAVAAWPFIHRVEPHSFEHRTQQASLMGPYEEAVPSDVQVSQIRANVIKSKLPGRLGLTGAGVVAGLGDAVYQGPTHVDLRGRHEILEPGVGDNGQPTDHGNHTTSILAGDGSLQPRFEGLAPEATIYTMRTGDRFSLALDQADPMVISSNSWSSSDPVYGDWYEQKGRYNINSQAIDLLLGQEKELLSVFSAGNSGGTQPGYPNNYLMLNPSYGAAKNTLVVGRYGGPIVASLAPSYGPSRDGRIKPDVVAQNRVHSSVSLNQYARLQGSSQSTPAVSGAAALLVEHYRNEHAGATPDGALIKAILMNTADYVFSPGPSFTAGWGLVNARRAAEVVSEGQFEMASVDHGEQVSIPISIPDDVEGKTISQVKIMVYWTDREASPYAVQALVNDLDVVVTEGATDHLPWVLDTTPALVAAPATRGVDSLNNVEQVVIDRPGSGTLTVRINGTSVPFGPQDVYVVYSFVLDELVITHPTGGEQFFSGQNRTIFWDTPFVGDGQNAEDVAYSLDGGSSWTSFHGNSGSVRVASSFIVPQAPLGLAQIRVTLGGQSVVSEPFTISERIDLQLDAPASGQATLSWNAVSGAATYEVLRLNEDNTWAVVHTGPETRVNVDAAWIVGRSVWLSVRAYDATGSIQSQRADAVHVVPVNSHPIAATDEVSVATGSFILFDILSNDSDADGDALYVTGISEATNGQAVLMDNQLVRYFPDSGFAGTDSFSYSVVDGMGGSATGTIVVSVVSGVEIESESTLPTDVVLAANYPNPFNPRTTIRFGVPVASTVSLSVYDVMGRRVAVLARGHHTAGWHQVAFDASALVSGVYFYQLQMGGIHRTRSMMLIK